MLIFAGYFGNAKIRQHGPIVASHQHICRLHIAMDDPACVGIVKGTKQQRRQVQRALWRDWHADYVVQRCLGFDIAQHQVQQAILFAILIDWQNIRVLELRDHSRLALEA